MVFSANSCCRWIGRAAASACVGGDRSRTLALPAQLNSTDAMTTHRFPAAAGAALVPPVLATWLSSFRDLLHGTGLEACSRPRRRGAVLAPGKRTVSEALRVMGLAARPGFARYHEVLSRARWDARTVARKLLAQVLDVFLPAGEVVIGIDDTIERRWGARIKAASTGIRCARRTATSSRPAACAGCR